MTDIRSKLFLSACIVNFMLILVETHNQAADQTGIQENFQNLFDSIAKNNVKDSEIYNGALEEEVAKERQAFDEMNEKLQIARNRYANKKRNIIHKIDDFNEKVVATKREVKYKKNLFYEKGTAAPYLGDDTSIDLIKVRHDGKEPFSLAVELRTLNMAPHFIGPLYVGEDTTLAYGNNETSFLIIMKQTGSGAFADIEIKMLEKGEYCFEVQGSYKNAFVVSCL